MCMVKDLFNFSFCAVNGYRYNNECIIKHLVWLRFLTSISALVVDCDTPSTVCFRGNCQTRSGVLYKQWHWALLRTNWQADRMPGPQHHRGPGSDRVHILRQNRHADREPDGVQDVYHWGNGLPPHSRWVIGHIDSIPGIFFPVFYGFIGILQEITGNNFLILFYLKSCKK